MIEGQNNRINSKSYGVTHDYSIEKMEKGLWFLKNKEKLKTILIVTLILFNIFLWSFSVYNIGYYLFVGMKNDETMVMKLTNTNLPNNEYMQLIAPHGFKYDRIQVFHNKEKYDLIVKIENINQKHLGVFTYCYESSVNNVSKCFKNFILPGESKYLFATLDKKDYSSDMKFVVNSIKWNKIYTKDIHNFDEFKKERMNFKFTNIEFINGEDNKDISEKINLASLKFNVENNTSFSYYSVLLKIFLYYNNSIVGVNSVVVNNFLSKTNEQINLTWPSITKVTDVKIVPEINILDDKSFMKP